MGTRKAGQGRGKKRCQACSSWKPRAAFYRRAASPDGLDEWCRDCRSAYRRAWVTRHRREYAAWLRNYREKNRERLRAYQREYQRRRRARLRAQKRTRKK
jgi:hypothetical protein